MPHTFEDAFAVVRSLWILRVSGCISYFFSGSGEQRFKSRLATNEYQCAKGINQTMKIIEGETSRKAGGSCKKGAASFVKIKLAELNVKFRDKKTIRNGSKRVSPA